MLVNFTDNFWKNLNLKFCKNFVCMFVKAKIVSKQSIESPYTILVRTRWNSIKLMVKNSQNIRQVTSKSWSNSGCSPET